MNDVIEINDSSLVTDECGTVIMVDVYIPNPYGNGSYRGMVVREVINTTYKNGDVVYINANKCKPFEGTL